MGIDSILQTLAESCRASDIPFLLVGGWALNAHGVSRQTLDVDILMKESDLRQVEELLTNNSYTKVYQTELFAKFRSEDASLMDIDCLLTDSSTMDAMISEAQSVQLGGATFIVPSILHMIAMKLHALKHNADRRYGRDMPDIIELVRMNELDAKDKAFKELCLQFGTQELYNDILHAVG